jgi:structural maintenance of chromosome 4
MEIAGCDTTREELTKRLPDLRSQCTLSAEESQNISDLNKKVEKCKSDMTVCAALASKLEKEVSKLQEAILDAGGPKLKKQQEACDKALANLNKACKDLNAAKVSVTSSRKAAIKAQNNKKAAEEELAKCLESLEAKTAEFKSLEDEALEVMQAYEQMKEVELEKRTALEGVTKEAEDLKKSQAKVKCLEVELVGKLDSIDKQIHECEKRAKHYETEITKLHEAEDQDGEYDVSDDEDEEDEMEHMNEAEEGDEAVDDSADTSMDDGSEPERSSKKLKTSKNVLQQSSLPTLPTGALQQYNREEVKSDISVLEKERESLAKNANMGAIVEYRKKEADYLSR